MATSIKTKFLIIISLLVILSTDVNSCQPYHFGISLGYNQQYDTSYLPEEKITFHDNYQDAVKAIEIALTKQKTYQSPALFNSDLSSISHYQEFLKQFKYPFLLHLLLNGSGNYLIITREKKAFHLFEIPLEANPCGFPNDYIKKQLSILKPARSSPELTDIINHLNKSYHKEIKKHKFVGDGIRKLITEGKLYINNEILDNINAVE
jgi:hypothetical protein